MGTKVGAFALALLGFAVLGAGWVYELDRPAAIAVSIRSLPESLKNGETAKIWLRAETNGIPLSHGDVIVDFWLIDWRAAEDWSHPQKITGSTDNHGLFITGWRPPCPGQFMVCAEVKKSGYTRGGHSCFLTAKNE